jgi:uncharacterized protein YjaZ
MSYQIHILKASGRLDPFISDINEVIEQTLKPIEEKINLQKVDIVVVDQPHGAIPEVGLGGYAPNKNLLYVYTDPARESFKEIIHKELPRTIAHELHHCARWGAVGYGESLFEALISEGLAEHFDIEVNKGEPTQWATALNPEQIQELLKKSRSSFDDKKYNHSAWFFGSDKENIPRWAGYALGFHIVGDYMSRVGKTASELTETSADSFKQILGL